MKVLFAFKKKFLETTLIEKTTNVDSFFAYVMKHYTFHRKDIITPSLANIFTKTIQTSNSFCICHIFFSLLNLKSFRPEKSGDDRSCVATRSWTISFLTSSASSRSSRQIIITPAIDSQRLSSTSSGSCGTWDLRLRELRQIATVERFCCLIASSTAQSTIMNYTAGIKSSRRCEEIPVMLCVQFKRLYQ